MASMTPDLIPTVIETPYRPSVKFDADPEWYRRELMRNVTYARAVMLYAIERGWAPYASHLLTTQILDDRIQEERDEGIAGGIAIGALFPQRLFGMDLGESTGMRYARQAAEAEGQTIHEVVLGFGWEERFHAHARKRKGGLLHLTLAFPVEWAR